MSVCWECVEVDVDGVVGEFVVCGYGVLVGLYCCCDESCIGVGCIVEMYVVGIGGVDVF